MGLAEWPSSICAYMYIQQKQAVPSLIDTLPSGEEKQKLGQKGGWLKREKPDLFWNFLRWKYDQMISVGIDEAWSED